jgi:high-affinity iron transporter
VAILVAYVVRTGNQSALRRIWIGVGLAIGLSIVLGAVLIAVDESLSEKAAEAFAGIMSLLAVGLITWMVFWMATRARGIRGHLHGELDRALESSAIAVALVAFVAVAREGLETALFLWAGIRSTDDASASVLGAFLGLATAVVIGVLVYRGAVRLNMARLFTWTGAALVIVAGGVLRYAVHEFQELGWLPGEDAIAVDVSDTFAPDGVVATLVRGLVNLTPVMSWLEVVVWLAYVIPTLAAFFWVIRRRDSGVKQSSTAASAG